MSTVDPARFAEWQDSVGRERRVTERLDPVALSRYGLAVGANAEADAAPLAHWAFFLPQHSDADIGRDGHPSRGGFLPAITLPRRMFAASAMHFFEPLATGEMAEQVSTVVDVTHKIGSTGDLVFVRLRTELRQDGAVRVEETKTFVYRDESARVALPDPVNTPPDGEVWRPDAVNLFRFSAATGNSHRIHYDLPYTVEEEGYPALVVHGPFTAARLAGMALRRGTLKKFEFRAKAPLFLGQPIYLRATSNTVFEAVRCDGTIAMEARAEF